MSQIDRIARLKIQLDDWQPVIWRRVEVPMTASLKALHDVIQAVMSFEDYHLFEFRGAGRRYAIPDPEWDSLRDKTYSAKTTKLASLIDSGVTEFTYTYDFGDNWQHTITVETTAMADPGKDYPSYIDGACCAPPEDIGGLPGFELFLEAMADPHHEENEEVRRWYGSAFDPQQVDEEAIRARVGKLARRRALGKAAFAKSQNKIN